LSVRRNERVVNGVEVCAVRVAISFGRRCGEGVRRVIFIVGFGVEGEVGEREGEVMETR